MTIEEEFSRLANLWRGRQPGVGFCPPRESFDMADFAAVLPWTSIYDIESHEPLSLRIRLVGEETIYLDGSNNTGKLLSDIFPHNDFPEVYDPYEKALETREPVITSATAQSEGGLDRQLSKLVLPMASDGREIDKFIAVLYFEALPSGLLDRFPKQMPI